MVREISKPLPEVLRPGRLQKPVRVEDRKPPRRSVLSVGDQHLAPGQFDRLRLVDALVALLRDVVAKFAEVARVAHLGERQLAEAQPGRTVVFRNCRMQRIPVRENRLPLAPELARPQLRILLRRTRRQNLRVVPDEEQPSVRQAEEIRHRVRRPEALIRFRRLPRLASVTRPREGDVRTRCPQGDENRPVLQLDAGRLTPRVVPVGTPVARARPLHVRHDRQLYAPPGLAAVVGESDSRMVVAAPLVISRVAEERDKPLRLELDQLAELVRRPLPLEGNGPRLAGLRKAERPVEAQVARTQIDARLLAGDLLPPVMPNLAIRHHAHVADGICRRHADHGRRENRVVLCLLHRREGGIDRQKKLRYHGSASPPSRQMFRLPRNLPSGHQVARSTYQPKRHAQSAAESSPCRARARRVPKRRQAFRTDPSASGGRSGVPARACRTHPQGARPAHRPPRGRAFPTMRPKGP